MYTFQLTLAPERRVANEVTGRKGVLKGALDFRLAETAGYDPGCCRVGNRTGGLALRDAAAPDPAPPSSHRC